MLNKTRSIPENFVSMYENADLAMNVYGVELANGKYAAKCFLGKAIKPVWFYSFKNKEAVEAMIESTANNQKAVKETKAKWAAERKAAKAVPMDVKVGTVFKASWGWEQTNVDFYEVTKIISPTMVEVTPISAAKTEEQWLAGKCVPVVGSFKGEPMKKKITGYNGKASFKASSCATAYQFDPIGFENGKPVFQSVYWSAYA